MQNGSFDVSASMPLFQGMRHQPQAARPGNWTSQQPCQDLEKAREDVSINIMTLYLDVLYNKELVGVAERQLR